MMKALVVWGLVVSAVATEVDKTKCGSDIVSCWSDRIVDVLDRASKTKTLHLVDDVVTIVLDDDGNSTTVSENRSIVNSLSRFVDTHRLQVKFPHFSSFLPTSEGRGKKNKGGYGMAAMAMGGSMVALGMAALAALAGKALAASMAALLMAALAAFRKGGGGGGGHHSSYDVISIPSHHRSFLQPQPADPPYKFEQDY